MLFCIPGSGKMDQLSRVPKGAFEFAQPLHMCFVDLEKALERVLENHVGISGIMRAVRSLRVGRRQSCPLSPILFLTFTDRISRCSQGVEGIQFG